jgi:hypothetical protein
VTAGQTRNRAVKRGSRAATGIAWW